MIYEDLGNMFEQAIAPLVSSAIQNIITAITPVVTSGVILYLMITGYMIIAGRIQEPIGDIMIKGVKIIIVATLALNASTVMGTVVSGINGVEEMFVQALNGQSNTYQALDNSLEQGANTVNQLMIASEPLDLFSDFSALMQIYIAVAIVMISSLLITVLGGAIYIMAKVSLAVVLGFSPFFIAGLFFPVTARWFDSWLSQAMNYALTGAIIVFFCSLTMTGFDKLTQDLLTAIGDGSTFQAAMLFQMLAYSIVCFFVTKSAPSIASGLASGIGVSGISLVGMMVGAKQLASYGISPFKALNNTVNPVSTRTDSAGQTHTTSRLNHLAHGRTMFRTAHRDAAIDRLALSDRRKGQAKAVTHAVMHPVQAIRNARNNEISNNSMPRTR